MCCRQQRYAGLLVVGRVVNQCLAAFGAGYGAARASGTTVATGVMPNALRVLGGFWLGRSGRIGCRSRWVLALVVSGVVNQGSPTFGAGGCRASPSSTSLGTRVMPYPFGVLGGFLFLGRLGRRYWCLCRWCKCCCGGRRCSRWQFYFSKGARCGAGHVGCLRRCWRCRSFRCRLGSSSFVALTTCAK